MLDEADSLANGGFFALPIDAIRAIRNGDSLGLAVALDSIRAQENLFDVNHALPPFILLGTAVDDIPDLPMWIRFYEQASDSAYLDQKCDRASCVNFWRSVSDGQITDFEAGRGRWSAVRARMHAMGESGDSTAAVQMAMMATLPSPGPLGKLPGCSWVRCPARGTRAPRDRADHSPGLCPGSPG